MMVCSNCKLELPLDNFGKKKNSIGEIVFRTCCKSCTKIKKQVYNHKNKEKILKSRNEYKLKCIEAARSINLITKICGACHLDLPISNFTKQNLNKTGFNRYCKSCIKNHADAVFEARQKYLKEWHGLHPGYNHMYHKNRLKNDVLYDIVWRLRTRLQYALKAQKAKKSTSTLNLVGCTPEFLKQHLESKFYPNKITGEMMTWDNRALWHIDHIIPCNKFNLLDEEEQRKCFHWTNLQPLWAIDNLRKGKS